MSGRIKISKKVLRNAVERLQAAGAAEAVGLNIQAVGDEVWICGRLPWSAEIAHRPFTDQDARAGQQWFDQFSLWIGTRTVRLALRRLAERNRYWPADGPAPIVAATLQPGASRDTWCWFVKCPYCRERHAHGEQASTVAHARNLLGHHSERCAPPVRGARGYTLIERAASPEVIERRVAKARFQREQVSRGNAVKASNRVLHDWPMGGLQESTAANARALVG